MNSGQFALINNAPLTITNSDFSFDVTTIAFAAERVNEKFKQLQTETSAMALNVFEIIDFRMLSGLVGEALVSEICLISNNVVKNPIIDGYPDLLNASKPQYKRDIEQWMQGNQNYFIGFPYGGIEVKNTFGVKKPNESFTVGGTRIGKISNLLQWKAHHVYTNNLLALFSDYIDKCPQIVAVMYSNSLQVDDWNEKQNPKEGSTMTSFSVTKTSAWAKLRAGLRLCRNDSRYLSFFR